jgi:MFS family permease
MAEKADQRRLGTRAVLRLPDFRKLFLAQAISDVGDGMTFMALMLLVNAETHSTAALAVLSIVVAVPSMVGGILAGAVADRFDRRRIMIASDAMRAILVLGFIVVGSVERLPVLYLVAFAQAAIGTLFSPARSALIPRVVPVAGLMAANSLGQMSRMIGNLTGTAVVGVLFALTGAAWPAFLFDAATFVASVALVMTVSPAVGVHDQLAIASAELASFARSVVDGLRLIGRSKTLVATVAGLATAMLGLGAVNVLFVPFLVDTLHESAAWAGPLEAAQTIAMVLSAGLVASLAVRFSAPTLLTGGLFGVGVMIATLSVAPTAIVVLPLLFVLGLFLMPAQVSTQTIVQTTVGDEARGRVSGAVQAAISTASVVSMAAAGIFANVASIREVLLVGGLICLAAASATAVLFRLDRGASSDAARPVGAQPAASAVAAGEG